MSKAVGNVVAPGEVIEKYGAEILRLWVSSEDYRDDVKVSDEILRQVSDAYRKIRNTIRYMLGNLADFASGARTGCRAAELPELDRWALARFDELKNKVVKSYEHYEFHAVYQGLNHFCGTTMSAFYLDIIKDRLYTPPAPIRMPRRAAQTVLYEILDGLLRLMSPVLSFTAAEAWESLYRLAGKSAAHREHLLCRVSPQLGEQAAIARWRTAGQKLIKLRSEITKALEIARRDKIIGHPLEAEVLLAGRRGTGRFHRPGVADDQGDLALFRPWS